MSSTVKFRLDDRVRAALDGAGVPWSVEPGKRHEKLLVRGRVVGVVPRASSGRMNRGGRAADNLLAAVRRAIRGSE